MRSNIAVVMQRVVGGQFDTWKNSFVVGGGKEMTIESWPGFLYMDMATALEAWQSSD